MSRACSHTEAQQNGFTLSFLGSLLPQNNTPARGVWEMKVVNLESVKPKNVHFCAISYEPQPRRPPEELDVLFLGRNYKEQEGRRGKKESGKANG